jgi:hypothetical protein
MLVSSRDCERRALWNDYYRISADLQKAGHEVKLKYLAVEWRVANRVARCAVLNVELLDRSLVRLSGITKTMSRTLATTAQWPRCGATESEAGVDRSAWLEATFHALECDHRAGGVSAVAGQRRLRIIGLGDEQQYAKDGYVDPKRRLLAVPLF